MSQSPTHRPHHGSIMPWRRGCCGEKVGGARTSGVDQRVFLKPYVPCTLKVFRMCISVFNYQEKLLNAHEHYVLVCTMTTMSYHAQWLCPTMVVNNKKSMPTQQITFSLDDVLKDGWEGITSVGMFVSSPWLAGLVILLFLLFWDHKRYQPVLGGSLTF